MIVTGCLLYFYNMEVHYIMYDIMIVLEAGCMKIPAGNVHLLA